MNEAVMNRAKMTIGAAIAIMVLALVMLCGFIAVVIHDANEREGDRSTARIYFCMEIETLKTVHRADINDRIKDVERSIQETKRFLRGPSTDDSLRGAVRRGLPTLHKRRKNLEERRLELAPVDCKRFAKLKGIPRVEKVLDKMKEG